MPVYFLVGERDVGVTDDEARELATRLPQGMLHDAIMARIGVNVSSPVRLDVGGDEQGNREALAAAIAALDGDSDELSPALRTLRARLAAAIEAP